jgi:hypothetical protein
MDLHPRASPDAPGVYGDRVPRAAIPIITQGFRRLGDSCAIGLIRRLVSVDGQRPQPELKFSSRRWSSFAGPWRLPLTVRPLISLDELFSKLLAQLKRPTRNSVLAIDRVCSTSPNRAPLASQNWPSHGYMYWWIHTCPCRHDSARSPPARQGNRATRPARLPSGSASRRSTPAALPQKELDMLYRSPPRRRRQGRQDPAGMALVALVPLGACSALTDSVMAADPLAAFILMLIAVAALSVVLAALATAVARAAEGLVRLAARITAFAAMLVVVAVLMGATLTVLARAAATD